MIEYLTPALLFFILAFAIRDQDESRPSYADDWKGNKGVMRI